MEDDFFCIDKIWLQFEDMKKEIFAWNKKNIKEINRSWPGEEDGEISCFGAKRAKQIISSNFKSK